MSLRVGVDVGGVLVASGGEGERWPFFTDRWLDAPAVEGAFDAVRKLVEAGCDVWVVSKCGPETQGKTWGWFEHHEFFTRTGVDPRQVRFCRHRVQKAGIAAELGLDVFVDDRLDVLEPMRGVVKLPILFGGEEPTPGISRAYSWFGVTEIVVHQARFHPDVSARDNATSANVAPPFSRLLYNDQAANDVDEIDEIVARDCDVHLEQLSDHGYHLGIHRGHDRHLQVNLWVEKGKLRCNVEDASSAPWEWTEVKEHE